MNTYTFDIAMAAAISVKANSVEDARKELAGKLECATVNFGAFDDGSPIIGEASAVDEAPLEDYEVFGEDGELLDDGDETHCRECGEPADDGEGYDGLCGNCADSAELES